MGPPSGVQGTGGFGETAEFKESFKNPWTTIPRPMNRFTEISAAQYERQEKEKQDLQKVLQEQIEQRKARLEEEKRKEQEIERKYEEKLKKDQEELKQSLLAEQREKDEKIKKQRMQNQMLMDMHKQNAITPVKEKPPQAAARHQHHFRLNKEEIDEKKVEPDEAQQRRPEMPIHQSEQLQEFTESFKGELQSMRKIIKDQDVALKQQVQKLVEKTQQSDQDKNRLVDELRKLREEMAKQQDERYEIDWQNLSRTAHWTNQAANYNSLNNARRHVISSEVRLKTTINPQGYLGSAYTPDFDSALPAPVILLKAHKQQEPLYQSSKMLNVRDFKSSTAEEDPERVRERNMDRLKLLQQYEEGERRSGMQTVLKYGEREEEEVNNRLSKIDKKLYYMLNPSTERIQTRVVPYQLESPYDFHTHEKSSPASGELIGSSSILIR
ncbi:hypothetical protein FGO68_gene8416 [Halteria grandinella]|uniref:Uncharacterized protein n=1 Tax=Halteria grandinella TaxID=5974 RepID=A0A8J8NWI8_HALGN|nr:hypothetical protein FGO68_gene8416 [Halteria grandinella]